MGDFYVNQEYHELVKTEIVDLDQMVNDIKTILSSEIDIVSTGIMMNNFAEGYLWNYFPNDFSKIISCQDENKKMLLSLVENINKSAVNTENCNVNILYKTIGVLRIDRGKNEDVNIHLEECLLYYHYGGKNCHIDDKKDDSFYFLFAPILFGFGMYLWYIR